MTTDAPALRRSFLIGKARPPSIIGRNREPGELLLLVGGGTLGLLFALAVPAVPLKVFGLVVLPGAAIGAVYVPFRHRTLYRWFEIDRAYRRLRRSGNARYRSTAMEAGVRADGTEIEVGAPPGVGEIRWMMTSFRDESIAVLLHSTRRTVTAALEIEGPGVGSRDSEDQEAIVERFGALLKHVANGDGFVRRLQILARTLPADPDAHRKDIASRGNRRSPKWLRDSYDDLSDLVSTSSEQHRNFLVACMSYTRELAAEALTYGGGDRGVAAVMARELADIGARLADADIKVRRPMVGARLASLIHSCYDPGHPIDSLGCMTPRNAWPAEADATEAGHLMSRTRELPTVTDTSWYHATAWIKEWPLTPVGVNFLAPLLVHTPDVIRTVAVTMDLEPTDVAIERMLSEKTNDDADTSRSAKLGRVVDPRDRAHSGRLDQRGDDLASGAAGVNLVGYVTVSARSSEELAKDKRTIRAAAGKSYLKIEWCDREHHRAFVNTLPFATGIKV